jgi:glutaredoxin 3
MAKKIILWSKTGCTHCEEITSFLSGKDLEFSNIDVVDNDQLRDVLEVKYGIRHVPVVEIGDGQTFEAVVEKDFERIELVLNS